MIHQSVLLSEVIAALAPVSGGIYVDANLGMGGHTEKILLESGPDGPARVAAACRQHGKFAMTAGLIALLPELVQEDYRVIGIGADVVALTSYVRQRLELVQGQIATLPVGLKPAARSPYA